jgi:4-hydroxy-tetrahydrodipicolinate synthase
MSTKYKGIVVPLITPVDKQERIDEPSLRKLVSFLIDGGVHGIFVNSTTGEGLLLREEEKKRILEIVIDQVRGRVTVYAGVSDTGTARALDNVAFAEKAGADVLVAHPPFYFPPNDQAELYDYFASLAQATAKPFMLYNIPFTTKAFIHLNTVKKLMQIENMIGLKDSSVDFVYLMNLIELKKERPDFSIFIGKTHMWAAGILSGADGGLDGISNLIPSHCVNLYESIVNQTEDCYERQREINEIWRVYECRSFLGGIKTAVSMLGLCQPHVLSPTLPASEEEKLKIKGILQRYHLLP